VYCAVYNASIDFYQDIKMVRRTESITTVAILLLVAISSGTAANQSLPSIEVKGAIEKPTKWTADSLRKHFTAEIKPIEYTSRGEKHTASCIALYSILHEAGAEAQMKMGPNVPPATKNHALRLAVVVSSFDGYTACFSLAELMPDFGNTTAWVALDSDGKPFPEGDGHVRVIVPTDKKPARSVRDVASINVVDVSK
jgi:hypothetical protein